MDITDPGKARLARPARRKARYSALAKPTHGSRGWVGQHRWTAALFVAAALALLLMLGGGWLMTRPEAVAVTPTIPTATTIVPTATPLPLPGNAYFTDTLSGFQLQYPQTWQSIPQNPGVEIDDNAQNPAFILQVLLPVESQDANTNWVAYELNNLRQKSGTTSFTLVNGTQQMLIGGATWTGGAATLQQGATTINVQVFVTIYKDRTYVINMLAANTPMATARARYFNAMLNTFTFAP